MTATPARLGFDDTIKRVVNDDGTVHFEMMVKQRWFRTVGPPISEEAAYAIVGRATRVWKVREIVDGKLKDEEWVLKDCWIFHDAATEKAIQDGIFAELSEDEREEARKYFLTYEEDDVIEHKDELELTPVADGEDQSFTNPIRAHRNTQASGSSSRQASRDAAASTSRPVPPAPVKLNHTKRKNSREVKREVCLSVYELSDFKSLCLCLFGIVMGKPCFFLFAFMRFMLNCSTFIHAQSWIRPSRRERRQLSLLRGLW